MCAFLAMARYLICHPEVLVSNSNLFQGTSQYDRYSKLFLGFIRKHKVDLKYLGIEAGDLGTHLCRKGVTTMVGAGCTVYPPIVSLCVRSGWVIGGVKDKYLKHESAGDQYIG